MRRALLLLLAMTAPAAADPWPASLVLPRGAVQLDATVEVELSIRHLAEPLSLAPDAWWGATDRLTLGVTTSHRALSRVDVGDGLCLRGEDHGCPRLYDNLALDGRWALPRRHGVDVAPRARLVATSFAPWKPSLRLGGLVRWRRGPWAVEADPHLQLGLANRDQGNRAQLDLPLWLRFQLGCRAAGWLHTGARGELTGYTEKVAIPVGVGGVVHLGRVDLGAELAFASLFGPQNQIRTRSAYVFVSTRL